METGAGSLGALLRGAGDRQGAERLAVALGLAPPDTVLPRDALPLPCARTDDGVRCILTGESRRGVTLLLVELDGEPDPDRVGRIARQIGSVNPARLYLLLFTGPDYRRLAFASCGLDGQPRVLVLDRVRPSAAELEALEELAAGNDAGVNLVLRHARTLDRARVSRRFFRDFRGARSVVAAAWTGLPPGLLAERARLGLLLLSRLMFLYFLQRRGHLAGEAEYLLRLLRQWRQEPGDGSFYRSRLLPLFFAVLNTRPEQRSAAARALGRLPFLNGGLFERTPLEERFPDLDLPDEAMTAVFDGLLERYRFTARDSAEAVVAGTSEAAIDPEMLGRVFEELMAPERRGDTGTFYTPAPVVDRVVRLGLAALVTGRGRVDGPAAADLARGDPRGVEPRLRARIAALVQGARVLDPACGSGAFLLGALLRLEGMLAALAEEADPARAPGSETVARAGLRRDIVARSLFGIDLQEDAALLCALRLWLALADPGGSPAGEAVPPLPNLDRRIRQGDALVDPLDLAGLAAAACSRPMGAGAGLPWAGAAADAAVRRAARTITTLADEYLTAEPDEKPALQQRLAAAERDLAQGWLAALERRIDSLALDLAAAEAPDLFGHRSDPQRTAALRRQLVAQRTETARLRKALEDGGAVPFFSFAIHMPEAVERGFDLIVSNPPWVRAHRWPESIRRLVRNRYEVCREAGWREAAALAGTPPGAGAQVDLALLFLERSVRLLAPGGALGMVLPAKMLRSLFGARARALILRELRLVDLEDHSLDQRSIFRADAFAVVLVGIREPAAARGNDGSEAPRDVTGKTPDGARRNAPREAAGSLRITMVRRRSPPLRFAVEPHELPLFVEDPESPWLLAPPPVRSALRRMQSAGAPLGRHAGMRAQRGVMTSANDVLVVTDVEPKLGGLARIRTEGYHRARRGRTARSARRFSAIVESDVLWPLVRGSDIRAWRYRRNAHVICSYDKRTARPVPPPQRAAAHLARHRTGGRPAAPAAGAGTSAHTGLLRRFSPSTLGPKAAWHDLASTLHAVALPAEVRTIDGRERPLLPLNTVYFLPVAEPAEALVLAAWMNSLPIRVFARSVAERAKDARFRFFAWTVSALPLPRDWQRGPAASTLRRLSAAAHDRGAIMPAEETELDRTVAAWYGLTGTDMNELQRFDRWLSGDGHA